MQLFSSFYFKNRSVRIYFFRNYYRKDSALKNIAKIFTLIFKSVGEMTVYAGKNVVEKEKTFGNIHYFLFLCLKF